MAHYAFLDDNNIVVDVIVGRDEDDLAEGVTSWEEYYGAFRGMRCLQTSYNTVANQHTLGGTPLRGNYAGIGYSYVEDLDIFIAPQPYDDWVLDAESASWVAPIPQPGPDYGWDAEAGSWIPLEA